MELHPFIEAERVAGRSIKRACELFKVSRAAFYQRLHATPSPRAVLDAELTDKIAEVHATSKGTYGSPRVSAELRHQGEPVGRRRVARLMREAGLEGRARKRWRRTTIADPQADAARDLIARQFDVGGDIDARYVGDITYIPTWEGWAYLATVIDLASRRVVGWALADHMRTELVTDALQAAFAQRWPPAGLIFHSDRGCQSSSACSASGSPPSPGSPVSSPRDSAVSSGCRCHADPHQRHGPYYQWTAKIDGKTVTRWLKSAAALYQQWIDNDRLLSGLINQMRDIAGHATVSSSKTPTPRPARLNAS